MSGRMRRVNEAVRQVLSEAVGELKDPRIGFVTVTGVETSPDLRHARVFVSVLGSEDEQRQSLLGLEAAHGVLQGRLACELRLKRTPQLAFEYDRTGAGAARGRAARTRHRSPSRQHPLRTDQLDPFESVLHGRGPARRLRGARS